MPGVFSSRPRHRKTEGNPLSVLGADIGPDNFTPTSLVPESSEPSDTTPAQQASNLVSGDVRPGRVGVRDRLTMFRQRFQRNRRNPLGDNLNAPY